MLSQPNFVAKTRSKRRDLEVSLEEKVIAYAERRGWFVVKCSFPGTVGAPDRLFIRHGVVIFIELKKHKERPTPKQKEMHERMRKYGAIVYWVDNFEDAKEILL